MKNEVVRTLNFSSVPLDEYGQPLKNSFTAKEHKKQIIDPVTREISYVSTFKPEMSDSAPKITNTSPISEIDVKLPFYPGTKLEVAISPHAKSISRYILGDLVLLRGYTYVLEYSDIPINEMSTNIPDIAPLPVTLSNVFKEGTSLYPKHVYKTQKKLIDHIKKLPSLYNINVSFNLIQPPDIELKLNSERAIVMKDILIKKKEEMDRQRLELEEQLSKLEGN
jgi:hypothetical protein